MKPVVVIEFNTLAASPNFFRDVIKLGAKFQQRVIAITTLTEDEQGQREVSEWMEQTRIKLCVYYTNGKPICEALKRFGIDKYILMKGSD